MDLGKALKTFYWRTRRQVTCDRQDSSGSLGGGSPFLVEFPLEHLSFLWVLCFKSRCGGGCQLRQ